MTETEKMIRRQNLMTQTLVRLHDLGIPLTFDVSSTASEFVDDSLADPETVLVSKKVNGNWMLAIITGHQ